MYHKLTFIFIKLRKIFVKKKNYRNCNSNTKNSLIKLIVFLKVKLSNQRKKSIHDIFDPNL